MKDVRVRARLVLDDRRHVEVAPGALIGRMPQCAVRIEDPRISEAHALVSLRGAQLRLLALRGRLSVDGKPKTDVALSAGLRVTLASFFGFTVESVELPPRVLAVSLCEPPWDMVGAQGVVAVFPNNPSPLRSGFHPDAEAHVWTRDAGSSLRRFGPEGQPIDVPLEPGTTFDAGGQTFSLDLVEREVLEARPTSELGRDQTRLSLVLNYDSVRVTAADGRTVIIDGIGARALCELWEIRAPIPWQEIAGLLWPEPGLSASMRRQRWDQLMTRVRMRLRVAGLRSDLLRSSQRGLVELLLGPDDVVEDLT